MPSTQRIPKRILKRILQECSRMLKKNIFWRFYAKNFANTKKGSTFASRLRKRPHTDLSIFYVFVAQLVEQLTLNQWVQGSSPCEDTKRSGFDEAASFFSEHAGIRNQPRHDARLKNIRYLCRPIIWNRFIRIQIDSATKFSQYTIFKFS